MATRWHLRGNDASGGHRGGGRAAYAVTIDAAATEGAPTLAEIMGLFDSAGYTGQMAARPGGHVLCFTCHETSDASEVEVEALRRTEGASDPDDMLAVVALVCPRCGTKATVVLGYGPEAGEDDSDVLLALSAPHEG